mgnify:CR=1 FL=1
MWSWFSLPGFDKFDEFADGCAVGEFDEGIALFEDGKPSENTQNVLKFCEDFENAGAQTHAFVEELKKLDLLMDGEVSIQQEGQEKPYVYRGFKMVDQEKLRDLPRPVRFKHNAVIPIMGRSRTVKIIFSKNLTFAEQIHGSAFAHICITYQRNTNYFATAFSLSYKLFVNLRKLIFKL